MTGLVSLMALLAFGGASGGADGQPAGKVHRRAALFVDKILRGARPAELPIEQPTRFETVRNLRTAGAPALTIPPAVLLRVDEAIR